MVFFYIEGSQFIISKTIIIFLSLKINFVLPNSADPDKMLHYVAFHLGLHCAKVPFMRFLVFRGLRSFVDIMQHNGSY